MHMVFRFNFMERQYSRTIRIQHAFVVVGYLLVCYYAHVNTYACSFADFGVVLCVCVLFTL